MNRAMIFGKKQKTTLAAILATLVCGVTFAADELVYIRSSAPTGASRAVIVPDGPLVLTGQIWPRDRNGDIADSPAAQIEQILENAASELAGAGASLDDAARLNVYLANDELRDLVQAALARRFSESRRPSVAYATTPHVDQRMLVSLDVVAPAREAAVSPSAVHVARAATPSGATSVCPAGGRIYIAGQAESGRNLAEATRKTLESLHATLIWLGRDDADILSLKAFVTPLAEAAVVQREIAAFFGDRAAPPLSLVEWQSSAATPIEIELVAWGGPPAATPKTEFLTPPNMTASPVFSRVVRTHAGPTIYLSSFHAAGNVAAAAEVQAVFAQLEEALALAGSDWRHLAKATYFVSNDEASQALNDLRPKVYDPRRPPAASKALVAAVGARDAHLALDMIAVPSHVQPGD